MSEYLIHKKQPYIDTLFYDRYRVEMSKASVLLKKFHDTYKRQNAWSKISYERSYSPDFLTMFFEHAGKDYEGMMRRIETEDCSLEPLAKWAAIVLQVPLCKIPHGGCSQ